MRERVLISLIILLFGFALVANAQTANTADKFGFDEAATTLAAASAMTVDVEIDGAVVGRAQPATCTGATSPFACATPIPAVTPGTHAVRLRVNETANGVTLTSAFSAVLNFTMRAVPATPANVRIVTGP